MADRVIVALVIALNAVALSVLYNRFYDTPLVQTLESSAVSWYHKIVPPKLPDRCGAIKWNEYVLVSNRVVLPDGVKPAAIYVEGTRIASIKPYDGEKVDHPHVLNFRDAVISPGVIDVHIHMNEPGREDWEGITTATQAALFGGVTTLIDMPLNSHPVTTTLEQLRAKQKLAQEKSFTNVGFWAGIVPGNAADHSLLAELLEAGALGFKSFMCPSGINDFANVAPGDVAAALPLLKARGAPFFVHAELVSEVDTPPDADPTQYETYMNTRPPKFEQDAIRVLVEVLDADTTPASPGFYMHIAHLADAGALPLIKEAKTRHPLTTETCPHYLTFAAEDIPAGKTQYKCAPPIRGADNRAALLAAVLDGDISLVSSDHSPAPPALKQVESGNFLKAWGGISGVQYLLPATWTALHKAGGSLELLAELLSEAPARLAGVSERKGMIQEGYDADLVVWEPESKANTTTEANRHRHKLSPYTDTDLDGKVLATLVNGDLVKVFGNVTPKPCGRLVNRRPKQ